MLLGKIRSMFSGQSQEEFGLGKRIALTKPLQNEVRRHVANLSRADLSGYSFERRHSDFPQAKSDLVVYDPNEVAILDGREMAGGEVSFWEKSK